MVQKISRRIIRTLRDNEPALARTMAASVTQRIACGERAGQNVRRIGSGFGCEGEHPALTGTRCARVNGFSLHANTQVPAHRRDQLECLLWYTARGAVALERLEEDAHGDLVYTFTKPWSDGTTGITLSPLELLEKLSALVPLPRVHLLARGETFSFLGFDFRRVKSRRGVWRPWYTPMRKKRTALLRMLKDIFRRYESQPVDRVVGLINPILRGWVRYFAVGDSSRCFGFIKDWAEKKVRRHLMRARNRKGFGWKRWRRRWLYDTLRLFHNYRVSWPQPKAFPVR